VRLAKPSEGEEVSTKYPGRESNVGTRRDDGDVYPFDNLALEYDAWFDKGGSLIFFIEVKAFKSLLPFLPKPWLEVGVRGHSLAM
jgi:hypothetical protein